MPTAMSDLHFKDKIVHIVMEIFWWLNCVSRRDGGIELTHCWADVWSRVARPAIDSAQEHSWGKGMNFMTVLCLAAIISLVWS